MWCPHLDDLPPTGVGPGDKVSVVPTCQMTEAENESSESRAHTGSHSGPRNGPTTAQVPNTGSNNTRLR